MVVTATYPDRITLATRAFGRGTDFSCRDREVEENGGVHVILTFWPELKTEFTQIMGRTARQGNEGSFQMILYMEDLKSFNIEVEQILKLQDAKADILDFLSEKRDELANTLQKDDTESLINLTKNHEYSLKI